MQIFFLDAIYKQVKISEAKSIMAELTKGVEKKELTKKLSNIERKKDISLELIDKDYNIIYMGINSKFFSESYSDGEVYLLWRITEKHNGEFLRYDKSNTGPISQIFYTKIISDGKYLAVIRSQVTPVD
ncbi:MAG: hypothetical protein LBD41_07330, partial [Clostridiales Family XIII bacterium]|nr:hypothetical protein [Clostridiales Family XIII bacterium]